MTAPTAQPEDQMETVLGLNHNFFAGRLNEPLVHQAVAAFQSNAKPSLNAQKGRGEVKHSTRKIRAQKGSGLARVGMTSSPTRRGGGRAFPNLGRGERRAKVNKKMFRESLKSIIYELMRSGRLVVVEKWRLPSHRTKDLARAVNLTAESPPTLMIVEDAELNKKLYLASRNLKDFSVLAQSEVNPRILLLFDMVFVSAKALLSIRRTVCEASTDET